MQAISEGEAQESEANGVVLKHKDQDFLGKEHSQSRERHRRVDALPVEARRKEVERLQGIIQNLRREAVTTKNKAEQEIKQRDAEIEALRRSCQLQREHIEKQKKEILALEFTLRDYRITDMDQQRALSKCNTNAEAQLHRLRLQLASMQQMHEQSQERAQQHLAASRKEKAAICMGLAAVAQQSIGGPDANAEDLAADVESAVVDNCEPIPRNASAWSQLKFHLDDMGNLSIVHRGPSSHLRPFDRDGARAVAALCAQVARLFTQRGALRSRLRSLEEQSKKGVHADSLVLQNLVAALQFEVHRLSKICYQASPNKASQSSSPKEETVAREDADGACDGAASPTTSPAPPEQGMAAVQQVVSNMLMLLSAAHKEQLDYRSGCSSPASKHSRSTPMASRGHAKGSPKRPRPTPAMTMYKEATDYCAAILQREVAAHNAARASASPPRTAHEQPSSYTVPLKLATKPGTAASGPAAARKGVVLHGQQQPQQQQGQRLQQKQQQQQEQQQLQQEQRQQPQQQREQQQLQQPQRQQPQRQQEQQQQQQQQEQQLQQEQQQEQPQEQQEQQQKQQQQQQQQQQEQHQQNPQEEQEQQQHEHPQQQEQLQPQPSHDMDGQEIPPPQQAPSPLSFSSYSALSSSSSSSSSSKKQEENDDDENCSSSGSSMQAGDDEFEEVEGED